ncbi:hypothetical protein FHS16_003256 [Paenibacillus endophyticus]|uniref:Uncharacterized protein n=1 Tax=Paenibacillus endophyticus TaxID=1294268 RepID=A0A7W5C9N5_9BACL|nr:hypothetical protein [Paenibacillus endophyticus]
MVPISPAINKGSSGSKIIKFTDLLKLNEQARATATK